MSRALGTALVLAALLPGQSLAQDAPSSPEEAVPVETVQPAPTSEIDALRDEVRRLQADRDRLEASLEGIQEQLNATVERQAAAEAERVGLGEVVRIEAEEVVREAVGVGEDIEVYGRVEGDATALGGNIVVAPTGWVGGDAVSLGGEVIVEDGGQIKGDRVSLALPTHVPSSAVQGPQGASALTSIVPADGLLTELYQRVVWFLSFTGAGVLMVGLFPNRVGRIAESVQEHPFRSTTVGVLSSGFLATFSLLFALVTLGLGLPVSFVVVATLGCAWMLGFVGLCQAVGDLLPFESRPTGRWLAFCSGSLLLTFVGSLPFLGWMVLATASAMGIGAAFSTRFGGR